MFMLGLPWGLLSNGRAQNSPSVGPWGILTSCPNHLNSLLSIRRRRRIIAIATLHFHWTPISTTLNPISIFTLWYSFVCITTKLPCVYSAAYLSVNPPFHFTAEPLIFSIWGDSSAAWRGQSCLFQLWNVISYLDDVQRPSAKSRDQATKPSPLIHQAAT